MVEGLDLHKLLSHNGNAKEKTKNDFLAHNFATRASVSAVWRSQQRGQNLHGPFPRAMLLITVEVSTQAMPASPKKYIQTVQMAKHKRNTRETQGLFPPPLAPMLTLSTITKFKQPICLCSVNNFILCVRFVNTNFSWNWCVYELIGCMNYTASNRVCL